MIDPPVRGVSVAHASAAHLSARSVVDRHERPIELPPIGPCPRHACLTVFVCDDSGSVVGGNDCVGLRYSEAALAVEHLRQRHRCGRELGAVLHFDRRTGYDARPTRLDRSGMLSLKRSLQAPPMCAGTSELSAALSDAEKLVRAHPKHRVALCVMSDFELFDEDVDQVLERLCSFPGLVHAVVLQSEPPPVLAQHGVVVTRIRWESERGDVARAILASLAAARRSTT